MDLQIKLANDGGALAYASPEIANLPTWAVWKNEAFGTTYEPIAIVYNKRLLIGRRDPAEPRRPAARASRPRPTSSRARSRPTTSRSRGVGFMLITQDSKYNPQFWDMVKALGAVGPRFQSSAGTMMERISSGENLLGFNIFNSYAALRAKKDPSIGIVLPKDYTLVMSRVMFIVEDGEEPERGQALARLHPVQARPDDHRQPGRARLDPQRRRGRDDGRRLHQAARRRGQADPGQRRPARLPRPDQAPRLPQAVAGGDRRPASRSAMRVSLPRAGVIGADGARGLPAARADLLPEPAQRAVLHAAQASAPARSSSSSPTATSGTRSRTRWSSPPRWR